MKKIPLVGPVVKWVGGKRQLLDDLIPMVPEKFTTYCEPFLGGAAMLLTLQPEKAKVNDINPELINMYEVIRDDVEGLLSELQKHRNEAEYFYMVRDWDRDKKKFSSLSKVEKAARLLFLNKTCYNGLFRVNSRGEFNTPFGRYKKPNIVNAETLRAVSKYFNRADIVFSCKDYADVLEELPEGSFVYLDPPYDPVSETASFTSYAKEGFGRVEQVRLLDCCEELNRRGIHFMLSNSATGFVKQLYQGHERKIVQAKRHVNSNADKRGKVDEYVVAGTAFHSLNEDAWIEIFKERDVLGEISKIGQHRISAKEIKKKNREPRLMVKFDHRANLPGIFSDHQLAILPVSRGDYLISDFKAYHQFEALDENIRTLALPAHIDSINPDMLTSECVALNCALAAGIFKDFLCEPELTPTVSGRMGSGEFEFRIDKAGGGQIPVQVKNAQIEIDLALEGPNSLCLIEAKSDISDDFIIRQLYYPYRTWLSKLGKPIRPVFMVCSNGVFRLYEYEFIDPEHYNSIRLVRQKNYSVENTIIREQEVKTLRKGLAAVSEPALPFPQADKFERVINLCELLKDNSVSQNDIAQEYDFDPRQSDYYANAGRYLGLIDKTREEGQTSFSITEKALTLLSLPYKRRQLELCRCLLEHEVFAEALDYYFMHRRLPDKSEAVSMMREANLHGIGSESTYGRRASTVTGWVRWMVRLWDKTI